jgi:hypothetical protein
MAAIGSAHPGHRGAEGILPLADLSALVTRYGTALSERVGAAQRSDLRTVEAPEFIEHNQLLMKGVKVEACLPRVEEFEDDGGEIR